MDKHNKNHKSGVKSTTKPAASTVAPVAMPELITEKGVVKVVKPETKPMPGRKGK